METVPSFSKLRKLAGITDSERKVYPFAVLGDCATQHLSTAVKGYAFHKGYQFDVFDADYDQVAAQTMDPHSELYRSSPRSILIFLCTEKLYEAYTKKEMAARADFAEEECRKITSYWKNINQYSDANILHFLYSETDDRIFGSYGLDLEISFIYQLKKLNVLLMEKRKEYKSVYLLDLNDIEKALGSSVYKDRKLYYLAKVPFSLNSLPYIAKKVIDTIKAMDGKVKKCVILDLDNTLWGGVIGDDGMEGIEIGELGMGHAFSDFQTWLRELKNRGIILGICSKNNDDTAKEPFLHHPEMVLRLEDISIFVANWNDKATNLRYIQKTLNIGMDSIVFLDDNPFERNLVRDTVEGITVPELPEDPAEYVSYLESLNLFETVSYSEADAERTKQYQAEVNRQELENEFASFDDYLESLEMCAEVKPFDSFHFPRIAQLTQRSNQFNLRTVRYTEDEIRSIAEDGEKVTAYFTLQDRFGDYGLISVLIMEKKDEETLFINEWLMSCRVLKRGMEEFIINHIVSLAKEKGYRYVIGEYIPTKKNKMVMEIYPEHGFEKIGEGLYRIDTTQYKETHTFIKEVQE